MAYGIGTSFIHYQFKYIEGGLTLKEMNRKHFIYVMALNTITFLTGFKSNKMFLRKKKTSKEACIFFMGRGQKINTKLNSTSAEQWIGYFLKHGEGVGKTPFKLLE